ncbi:MAG: hypothetical protein LBS79_04250 [Tannerella sp.]|jgi:predicted metalloprotease|nr:hypothetical protein [Tannerella sp.]
MKNTGTDDKFMPDEEQKTEKKFQDKSIGYMTPAFVHQTGLKTERKWKNYYRSASNPYKDPSLSVKEEAQVLQHVHSASAPPSLHCHAASRETNRKQKCEQKE